MQNIKTQLLLSHLVLVLLMILVMIGAVINFSRLGNSVNRILKDNYASVIAAQDMKETLERQDSAATFVLAGQVQRARKQYEENVPLFVRAYSTEAHNITERGEQEAADAIRSQYSDYTKDIRKLLYADPPMPVEEARSYYFRLLEPSFVRLKDQAQHVLDINQQAIVRADKEARAEATRATTTGILVTIGATLVALFIALPSVRAAIQPLRSLARQAEEIGAGHYNGTIVLHRTDEIGTLAVAFNQMTEKLRAAWEQEERRLHRAERMSDAALESLYDPVIVTDSQGAVVHWNRAAAGLFGPEQRALGLPIARVVPDRRITEAVQRAVHQEHVSAAEDEANLITLQVEEAQRTYRLRATPMHEDDGTLLGAVAVLEDITHLRELDRLKTEFVGVASHELRTPVTSLLLANQLLEEGAAGPLTPDQREVVAAQKEDLMRLERMMRDLLDMTRLEAGVTPPRFQILPADLLMRGAVDSVRTQAAKKGVILIQENLPDLPEVRADRAQIVRVLVNLINNAVRHTLKGGKVTVRASLAPDGRQILFQVEDTGSGIPAEYLKRIFERFVQVPGATGGGSGLGLSIAQTIIRAHGGTIEAVSELNRGSTFTFTLTVGGE